MSGMNEYVEILKRHVAENPPNYGSDAQSILEMLFTYYHECNNTDTDAVKAAFEDLYHKAIKEFDRLALISEDVIRHLIIKLED